MSPSMDDLMPQIKPIDSRIKPNSFHQTLDRDCAKKIGQYYKRGQKIQSCFIMFIKADVGEQMTN